MSGFKSAQFGNYTYGFERDQPYIYDLNAQIWSVLTAPSSNAQHRSLFGIKRAYDGPFTWRLHGDNWTLERVDFSQAEPSAAATAMKKSLFLVLHAQAEGEPDHWALFVAIENESGDVYQVKGDAEKMYYAHALDVDLFKSASYKTSYTMVPEISEAAEQWVKYYATSCLPPSAPNRREVKENCQGWAYRVLSALLSRGIVKKEVVAQVHEMVQKID